MEENIFDALPDFDRLLEQKSFKSLSDHERELVLQFITEEDYTQFRESVLVAKQEKNSRTHPLSPDPSVKNRLLQTFRFVETSPSPPLPGVFSRFLSYGIPVYKAGIAASVLLFLVFYLLLQNYRMAGQLAVADTVYIDKPFLLKDTVWLEKPQVKIPLRVKANLHHPGTRSGGLTVLAIPENQLYASQMRDAMSRMSVISELGKDKSVSQDTSLMKLVRGQAGELVSW